LKRAEAASIKAERRTASAEADGVAREVRRRCGARVSELVPPVFTAYVKVLHPVYVNEDLAGCARDCRH
jgi:hypothetical protein